MKSLLIITLIFCFFGYGLSENTKCPLNLSCDSSNTSCQNELNQFQQCISTKCDSQSIQSQDAKEIFDCYYVKCKTDYQPFQSEILKMFQCLNLTQSEETQDDTKESEAKMEEIKANLLKSKQDLCLAQMITDCLASTKECVPNFYFQLYCISSQCQLEDNSSISDINKCIQSTCQSNYDELKKLNIQFSQCLQQLSNISFGYIPGVTILLALILIVI
ncbi:transmembrane protein, putative (macronuclear) [Tetrahymena thermophila SB210]|uniref:Transmembrane protein, putative n=1 Tax=Tetrahymena thermophila (strain SB210) TaxID=312017 RepID=Q22NA6_TETTS|nr:transmembrane protein, putative [Tetrahymena thermophila SB210]EAR86879.1 transmembrane protein, putative [Tetrahymena thermophila SB210]|eukprot:XP_001007124.1 transmembrane protein, putative [Tetrahymena thermophila SB210]